MKVLFPLCLLFSLLLTSSAVKMNYNFDKDVCLLDSYSRPEPEEISLVGMCRDGFNLEYRYCRQICKPGFYGLISSCWENCPAGFQRESGNCFRPVSLKSAKDFSYTEPEACAKLHGKCVRELYSLIPVCSASSNLQLANRCWGESYPQQIENPKYELGCESGREKVAGGCYVPCEKGYHAVGNTCTKSCPSGYLQCGGVCTKDRSCQDGKVQKIEGFLASMEQVAEKYEVEVDFSRMMCS